MYKLIKINKNKKKNQYEYVLNMLINHILKLKLIEELDVIVI